MKIAKVRIEPEYIKFQGGLDLDSPALSISPGALSACLNYEAGTNGGYRRVDGYERYSGQTAPSDATYYKCTATITGTVAVGNTVTGMTSGATAVICQIETGYFNVTKLVGPLQAEGFLIGGAQQGTITAAPSQNGEDTGYKHAVALNCAADIYRADIAAPVGSGPVRGIANLKGVTYCFRDNAGATAGLIYKATTAGWTNVPLYHQISFASGVASIADGTAISQAVSGATAVVKRTVLESGEWGSTAAGRLILGTIVGSFDATNVIQVGAVTKMTASSLATQITILPGGRYETVENNFASSLATKRIYGCDGINKGFEFDGDVYIPLNTGMTVDTPDYVAAFKSLLIFGFKGSYQNAGVGTPYEWTAVTGALEIGMGDDITGFSPLGGDAFGIFSRNRSDQLIGANTSNVAKTSISDEVGCIPRTIQRIGYVYCLDDRGVIRVTPSDRYGNFEQSTISRLVQPLINSMRSKVVASTTYKTRNQYRLYGSDGTGICMTILDKGGYAFTPFEYPVIVACAKSGEDTTGRDIIFFGDSLGMVYQADKGSSFDGEEIESFISLPFNHSKSPSVLKSYLSAVLEMTSEAYSACSFSIDFAYGDPDISAHVTESKEIIGSGGTWDVSTWDQFFYDAFTVASPSFPIEGNGNNMSLSIYSKSDIDLGHKLDGILLQYIKRRLIR